MPVYQVAKLVVYSIRIAVEDSAEGIDKGSVEEVIVAVSVHNVRTTGKALVGRGSH